MGRCILFPRTLSPSLLSLSLSLLILSIPSAAPRRLPNIYWNSSNPIFDISNTDHIISVKMGDQLSIVCPHPDVNYEYSSLHLVSEEEYKHCSLRGSSRPLGACVDDSTPSSLSLVFRKYSPIPGGLEFHPGSTYYVITTSDGSKEGIEQRKGGLCETAQMKIKFEVENDAHSVTSRNGDRSNPKFAARTVESRQDGPSVSLSNEDSTQVMYIIHDGNDNEEEDSSSLSIFPSLLLFLLVLSFS